MLEKARRAAARHKVKLDIPAYYKYRPHSRPQQAVEQEFQSLEAKIDFAKLTANDVGKTIAVDPSKAFRIAASRRKSLPLSYVAAMTGQVEELMDFLSQNDSALNQDECLYRPSEKSPSFIDLVERQGKLAAVFTVANWRHNAAGLDKVIGSVETGTLNSQLKDSMDAERLKRAVGSAQVKKSYEPIQIKIGT